MPPEPGPEPGIDVAGSGDAAGAWTGAYAPTKLPAMRLRSAIIACVAGIVLLQPLSAVLARPAQHDGERVLQRRPPADAGGDLHATTFTPDSAAREIQRMHGGRVLAVQADGAGYRVKMLKDGEVRIYQVDP